MHQVRPDPVRPGQESVWDYPRPARAELTASQIPIRLGRVVIADTWRAVRTLETSHPPSYYIPPADVVAGSLVPAAGSSFCEWKGQARYFDVVADDERRPRAAWSYPAPTAPFAILRDHVLFYAGAMEACFVDGELVVPQAAGFYGGWITPTIAGPFKGGAGSQFW